MTKQNTNKEKLSDNLMFQLLKEYVDFSISSLPKKVKLSSVKATRSKIKTALSQFINNIEVESLNHFALLKYINAPDFDKRNLIIIVNFILFLIDKNLVKDDKLNRFNYLRNRFSKMVKVEDVLYVLDSKGFDDYVESNFFNNITTQKMSLFFIHPNIIDYENEHSYEYISNYLHTFKLNADYTTLTMLNVCREFLKIAKIIFKNSSPNEISFDEFRAKIRNNIDFFSETGILQIVHLMQVVSNKETIIDQKLSKFVEISDYFSKQINKKKFLDLLESDSIEDYFYVEHSNKKNYIYLLNIENEVIKEAFSSFLQNSQNIGLPLKSVAKHFKESLLRQTILSIYDLNIESYVSQIRFFKDIKGFRNNQLNTITSFYNYVAVNYNPDIFISDGFSPAILHRAGLAVDIANGYELISLNPYEPIPLNDKWLLYYGNMNTSNSAVSTSFICRLDFSLINNEIYRKWHKHYFWHNSSGLSTKKYNFTDIVFFLNYIEKIKRREVLTIYTGANPDKDFNVNDAIAYKSHIYSIHNNNRTRSSYIYSARLLLKHVVDYELFKIDENCFYHLTHTLSSDYNNAMAIPDDELKRISNLMRENSYESAINSLYYAIFYIALETEFRPSQIVTLPLNCYQETAKPNEYVLNSKTKRHSKDPVEQAITIYVKRQIDEIMELTKEYRNQCHVEILKEYLFVVPASQYDRYKLISVSQFNKYFQKCCNELNLRSYSMQNLRDTHMTKAEEFSIRNSMSDLEQSVLTGHVMPETTSRSYVDTQLTELLEAVHGIIIGNVDINGTVVKKIDPNIENPEHLVEQGCGYCDLKSCKETTMLGCLICSDFVTTVSRLPYFDEQIKTINEKLLYTTLRHDKEDLVSIKTLLVAYKREIMKRME